MITDTKSGHATAPPWRRVRDRALADARAGVPMFRLWPDYQRVIALWTSARAIPFRTLATMDRAAVISDLEGLE